MKWKWKYTFWAYSTHTHGIHAGIIIYVQFVCANESALNEFECVCSCVPVPVPVPVRVSIHLSPVPKVIFIYFYELCTFSHHCHHTLLLWLLLKCSPCFRTHQFRFHIALFSPSTLPSPHLSMGPKSNSLTYFTCHVVQIIITVSRISHRNKMEMAGHKRKRGKKDAAFKVSMGPVRVFDLVFHIFFCFDSSINLTHFSWQSNSFIRSLEFIVTLHHQTRFIHWYSSFPFQFVFDYFNCVPISIIIIIITIAVYFVMHVVELTTAVCPLNGTWCNGTTFILFRNCVLPLAQIKRYRIKRLKAWTKRKERHFNLLFFLEFYSIINNFLEILVGI